MLIDSCFVLTLFELEVKTVPEIFFHCFLINVACINYLLIVHIYKLIGNKIMNKIDHDALQYWIQEAFHQGAKAQRELDSEK